MTPAQTQTSLFTPEQERALQAWTTYYPYPIMGLLEAMRQVQHWHLCMRPEAEEHLAKLFKTTRAHVHEVATFFPSFTAKPTGRKRIGVCHGISCAMAGASKVCQTLQARLDVPEGQATDDGEFSWEELECIGACDHAPAFQVNDRLQGKATDEAVNRALKGEKLPAPGALVDLQS